jgi:hypothetical protein
MDDPRLVALGLVPPPPGQERVEETPAAPASPAAVSDWQQLQQSQYLPPPNPFSAAASTIPEYPDPFTSPPAPPTPAPQQPTVPSIFNSPNSPFSFAPPAPTPVAAPVAPPSEPTPAPTPFTSAPSPFTSANSPFTSANSPFSVGPAPATFTAAPPAVASPTTREGKREAKRAAEEAKRAAKVAEEEAKKAAVLAAAQAKIDEREAKIAERQAKKSAKGAKPSKQAAAPAPWVPPVLAAPMAPTKTPADVELMAAIAKQPGVITKDVRFGLVGRARLELAPIGFSLVQLRGGTAYTWAEVKDIKANRGRVEITTEADRERVVTTKESATTQRYVEKLTRALVVSIDGATEPDFAPFVARLMQDMRAQTFNYHATSWLDYENALERLRSDFAEHDDQFVPAVAGALFAFIFIAGLAILPEIINLATDIRPPAGAFVIQPRYGWFDLRSAVMAIGLSALLTRLVLRLGLGPSALSWARGTLRGWQTKGPRAARFATRELARLLLSTSVAAAALLLGFFAFAPTVASTIVIDDVGVRELVPLPIVGIDKKWSEVTDVQKSAGPGRLEGFGVTVIFSGGRWVTTVDHDLSGGSDGVLLQKATSLWQNATR